MAYCEMKVRGSNSLGRMNAFAALVPEGVPGPFPVLYLLHGYSDDHTGWVRRSNVERYAERYPMIIIMPDGQHGWYTDAASMPYAKFETHLADELVGFVDTTFSTIADRRGRAIAGLSMGGYGALKLAVKHPDKFCAGHSFSGAVGITMRDNTLSTMMGAEPETPWSIEQRLIFGETPTGGPEDLRALILAANKKTMPAISFDCGVDDFLYDSNQSFHAFLTEKKIPHIYEQFPGAHDWDYWDTHIQEVLARMAKHFGIKKIGEAEAEKE